MNSRKKTVLIVEDEAGIADSVVYALERDGFLPVWNSTGIEALESLKQREVDLIVLDLGLPDTDGLDLLRTVRTFSRIPVLILSARNEDMDRIIGLEVGADDFVSKPFSPREVSARVRAILRRYAEHPARESAETGTKGAADSTGPFHVDPHKRIISYHGVALSLSRYEYGILELLIRRPGWVFSREQILDQVWEEPEERFDRVVDTHIKNIRAQLKSIRDAEDPIETRRGMGYCLKESET